jgi:group II intron reverse transcriptase/maturase/CRISPR-associated endonuclease Cas1
MDSPLFDRFLDEKNFILAYKRVAAKGSRGGIDRVSVEEFGRHLERNINHLQRQIRENSYMPQPVESVHSPKFNEADEWRELGLPAVADKVVQTAMLYVVEPLAEKLFLDTSYGYRPGRGPYKAIRRVEHNLGNRKLQWIVRQDIDNFFDSLDHDRLLSLFSDLVHEDSRLVELIVLWCRMGIVKKDGRWKNVEAGVRQGQVISPLLANLYLHSLDEFVADKGWGWVRYADDYILQCTEKAEVEEADREVTGFLKNSLGLKLNQNDNPVSNLDHGFVFLGIYFKKDKREISQVKLKKMDRKIEWILSEKNRAGPEKVVAQLTQTVDGWRRYYSFINPESEFSDLDRKIEKSLSKMIRTRVNAGAWPKKPSEDITLPQLMPDLDSVGAGRKRLAAIWKEALSDPVKEAIKQADRKVGTRRRRHQRSQAVSGDLFVTSPGHFIGKRGERLIVRHKQVIVAEIPGIKLKGLTVAGSGIAISSDVIQLCSERDVHVYFVDKLGRVFSVAQPPDSISAEIVLLQVRHRDDKKGRHLARMFVLGKIKNQMALLKSYSKYKKHREGAFGKALQESRKDMEELMQKVKDLTKPGLADRFRQSLMGLEGTFGSKYWQLVGHLLPDDLDFQGRTRKGAKDLVNSLLNYGYGILYSQTLNAVIMAGLNSTAGFLHSYQSGKPVLVYDLVEEFRATVVDRAIFSMLNRREILEQEENGLLKKDTRKKIAGAVLSRLGSEVNFREKRLTLEEVLKNQAMAIKRHLLGKDTYRPYLAKW